MTHHRPFPQPGDMKSNDDGVFVHDGHAWRRVQVGRDVNFVLNILRDYGMHEPTCPLRQHDKSQAHTSVFMVPPDCTCWLSEGGETA